MNGQLSHETPLLMGKLGLSTTLSVLQGNALPLVEVGGQAYPRAGEPVLIPSITWIGFRVAWQKLQ
jgi:hypothetical protein